MNTFVVSAPNLVYKDNKYVVGKPVEIYMITGGALKIIYQGETYDYTGSAMRDKDGTSYKITDANYNVSVNYNQEIFLEDPIEGRIILLK